ncbi:MAG: flagellar export chaperone FliS [Bryobacterales bacterium]|nr:flagellar export chaperone FliS [Bryobacterales bacterium]
MQNRAYDAYLESRVMSADRLELVRVLYEAAIDAIVAAQRHVREKNIRLRSDEISKAQAIIGELAVALDDENGGEISRNLRETYGWVMISLATANAEQREEPLAHAEGVLRTLLAGWRQCVLEPKAAA